jgi:hypothetical protein
LIGAGVDDSNDSDNRDAAEIDIADGWLIRGERAKELGGSGARWLQSRESGTFSSVIGDATRAALSAIEMPGIVGGNENGEGNAGRLESSAD